VLYENGGKYKYTQNPRKTLENLKICEYEKFTPGLKKEQVQM